MWQILTWKAQYKVYENVYFYFHYPKAWLMNASIRENIIFGKAFKPKRYV
jgi:hypothetical protein